MRYPRPCNRHLKSNINTDLYINKTNNAAATNTRPSVVTRLPRYIVWKYWERDKPRLPRWCDLTKKLILKLSLFLFLMAINMHRQLSGFLLLRLFKISQFFLDTAQMHSLFVVKLFNHFKMCFLVLPPLTLLAFFTFFFCKLTVRSKWVFKICLLMLCSFGINFKLI